MADGVWTRIQLAADLAALKALAGYTGVLLRLFKNDFNPTDTTVSGDLTEADYTGYAPAAITFTGPFIGADGSVELVGTSAPFAPSGTTVGNTIFGCHMLDFVTNNLVFASRFDNPPLPMGVTTDFLQVGFRWRILESGLIVTVN